jgi:hypothetical protein
MSGGSIEYVAAYVDNGQPNLTTYAASVLAADPKYKGIYTKSVADTQAGNYALAINKKGDALYETSLSGSETASWYSNTSRMPYSDQPWIRRGGRYDDTTLAGLFSFDRYVYHDTSFSYRPVLLIGEGL